MVATAGSTLSVTFDSYATVNPSTSKSTDILFTQIALGEGPVYRINPNGPQDIEIGDRYIDDLVDFRTNNTRSELFAVKYATGTLNQLPMYSFSGEQIYPVRFTTPVVLKSGTVGSTLPGITAQPAISVTLYPTQSNDDLTQINSIRFKFNVLSLQSTDSSGTQGAQLNIAALIHNIEQDTNYNDYIVGGGLSINSLIEDSMIAELEIKIPDNLKNPNGYRVSAFKLSPDVAEEGYSSEVEFIGFDEVRSQLYSYPYTALAGYAVKSSDFRTGAIPEYSSLLKGLIVKVPSNYNQPILQTGEIDWRQVEVPSTGIYSAASNGYRTQTDSNALKTTTPINIYRGVWDGTFKYDWTENPVWIIYNLLTDTRTGLGLPESSIDKFNFYSVAQYCDAVDPFTGNFVGVPGFADGSFRYKPNQYLPRIEEALLGLPEGTEVRERRFICGLSITDKSEILTLVNAIASGFRATFTNSGNKIKLIVDRDNTLPSAVFNESNIEQRSFKTSGIREEDIITGVEVSYINFANHFKKETVVVDANNLEDFTKENRISIDAVGCTRKSQAIRLAKYILDTNRNLRRKLQFTAFADAADLNVGEIISVSQKATGVSYGFGGQVFSNSTAGSSTVLLEHFTNPAITSNVFSSNSNPLSLRIFNQDTNTIDNYIVSNTSYQLISTGNTYSGHDVVAVNISDKYSPTSGSYVPNTLFSTTTAPSRGDLWALGEVNPRSVFTATDSKLFRVDSISLQEKGKVNIVATEYNPEILQQVDDSAINLISLKKTNLSYVSPPTPSLSLKSIPSKTEEGIITYNLLVSTSTDSSNYDIPTTTVIKYGVLSEIFEVNSQQSV